MTARAVTIFGDGSSVDQYLARQLVFRGAAADMVGVPIGWPEDVKFAIARVDTAAGADALRDLARQDLAAARVICMCENPETLEQARDIRAVCAECSEQNVISLLWHPRVSAELADGQGKARQPGTTGGVIRPEDLAFVVAREYVTARRAHLVEQSVVLDGAGLAT